MRAGWLPLSLALLSGCAEARIVYERDAEVDAGVADVGIDATSDAGDPCRAPQDLTGMPEGCELVRPPPRPLCAGDGDVPPFEVGFLEPDFTATNGYDLDGYCTAVMGATSCTNADGAVPDTTTNGTDNSFAFIVVEGLEIVDPAILGSFANANRERGVAVPMLRIEDWNGLDNDEAVVVTFAVSTGATETPDWMAVPELNPADGFFSAGGMPLTRDLGAYVSNGQLVATVPDSLPFDFVAEGRRLRIALRDARIVANVDTAMQTIRDFSISGRWSVAEALDALELLAPCPEEAPLRAAAMNLLRRAADVRADRTEDRTMLECNAISLALRFREAHPITWGEPRTVDLTPTCM